MNQEQKRFMNQPNTEFYLSHFNLFEKNLNGESKSPLHSLRKLAMSKFAATGFPTTKEEEWRFTNVLPIAKMQFAPVLRYSNEGITAKDIEKFSFGGLSRRDGFAKCVRLVFINGHFAQELSSIPSAQTGVKMGSLATAMKSDADILNQHLAKYVKFDENGFTALSTAFILDGAFIHIADNAVIADPIHLLFIVTSPEGMDSHKNKSAAAHPRNLIIAGKNSKVSIVERYVSLGSIPCLTNAVTEFVVGENASVEHDKLQDESVDGFHIGTIHFQQSAKSNIVTNAINLGGSIVRNNITAVLNGEGI